MSRLSRWYAAWKHLAPAPFIGITGLLVYLTALPIAGGFELAGLSAAEIGAPDLSLWDPYRVVASALLLAPAVETLLTQSLPFYLLRRWGRRCSGGVAVAVSAVVFALCHTVYSFWYAGAVLPGGLLLALTYRVFQGRRESAFWMTAGVHAAANFLVLALEGGL